MPTPATSLAPLRIASRLVIPGCWGTIGPSPSTLTLAIDSLLSFGPAAVASTLTEIEELFNNLLAKAFERRGTGRHRAGFGIDLGRQLGGDPIEGRAVGIDLLG